MTSHRLHVVTCCCWFLACTANAAHDWPQWGGPARNFKVGGPRLAQTWPPGGPPCLWDRPLGDGYAGIASVGNRLYTMYRNAGREYIVALDANSGKTIWQHHYPAPFLPKTDLQPGPGPHATPLVAGDRLCTAGVTGIVHCLDLATGAVIWQRNLVQDFAGTVLFRGYSCNPLRYGDSVILTVGGQGQGVVALTLSQGNVKWKSQNFDISHASPIVIQFRGQAQLVVLASRCIVGMNPDNGLLLWSHEHPMTGGHIASMPVWGTGDRLFFSFAYGGGSYCLQLADKNGTTTTTQLWQNKRMKIHHSNAISTQGYLYASSGDFGPKLFSALNLITGKLTWQQRTLGRCSLVYRDGNYLILQEDGQLTLATLTPESLKIHAQAQLFQERAWTPPTLAGTRLYVRNRSRIMAYELPAVAP